MTVKVGILGDGVLKSCFSAFVHFESPSIYGFKLLLNCSISSFPLLYIFGNISKKCTKAENKESLYKNCNSLTFNILQKQEITKCTKAENLDDHETNPKTLHKLLQHVHPNRPRFKSFLPHPTTPKVCLTNNCKPAIRPHL